jgi:hypothetical protein
LLSSSGHAGMTRAFSSANGNRLALAPRNA